MATPVDSQPSNSMSALYHSLGHAVLNWAYLEHCLADWFADISGISRPMARDIFFSVNNFKARLDLTRAAMENSRAHADDLLFTQEIVNKADAYSKFRNRCVHSGIPTSSGNDPTPRLLDSYGWFSSDKFENGITAANLRAAAKNFYGLATCIRDGSFALSLRGIPEAEASRVPHAELLARVQQLPNEPGSNSLSQRQRGREMQRQAAEQKIPGKQKSGRGR